MADRSSFCANIARRGAIVSGKTFSAKHPHQPQPVLHGAQFDLPIQFSHRRRRQEGVPLLLAKFEQALRDRIPARAAETILSLCGDRAQLEATPVRDFMRLFAV